MTNIDKIAREHLADCKAKGLNPIDEMMAIFKRAGEAEAAKAEAAVKSGSSPLRALVDWVVVDPMEEARVEGLLFPARPLKRSLK